MKKIVLLLIHTFAFQLGIAQQVTFQKSYGGILNDEGKAVLELSDKSILLAGTTLSYGAGVEDFYLIKTDSMGNVLWNKTYGSLFKNLCNYMIQASDGGFVLFGISDTGNSTVKVFLVIKTDLSGNIQWSKTYATCYQDTYNSIQQTTDGGYVFVGEKLMAGSLDVNIALIKIDSVGNIEWSKTIGGSIDDFGNEVRQTSDGGFVVTGYTDSYGAGGSDVFLIKTDSTGTPIWTKTFGGSDSDLGYSVKETLDGGFIVTGSTNNFAVAYRDVFLIKQMQAECFNGRKTMEVLILTKHFQWRILQTVVM